MNEWETRQVQDIASSLAVYVQWPDDQVRQVDDLGMDERYWVAYVANNSAVPLHNVIVHLLAQDEYESYQGIDFGVVDAHRRDWFILRPDVRPEAGFDPDDERPDIWIEFEVINRHCRFEKGRLTLLRPAEIETE